MTINRNALAGVALLGLLTGPAAANDSMAEIGVGGLVLARSDEIEMAREDLYISADEIRVDYVFSNRSDKDVESIVAFPLPDITFDPDMLSALPGDAPDNFLGFEVSFDGQKLSPELDQRAYSLNVDVTDVLKSNSIPLYGYAAGMDAALAKLPPEAVGNLLARGMLSTTTYTDTQDGNKEKTDLNPNWELRSAYWWKAKFPAGKEIKVSHRYKPLVGGTSGVSFFGEGKFTDWSADMRKTYCVDAAIEKALKKAMDADGNAPFYESYVDYVLTSGGNWFAGQIGEFHLTIDKGDPKNLVSFCGEGVKKTGPTTFELTAKDFVPENDLKVLFVIPRPE